VTLALGAGYKFSYLLTYLVTYLQAENREVELKLLQQERRELRERLCESRARDREMTSVMNDLQLCLNDLRSKVRGRSCTSRVLL